MDKILSFAIPLFILMDFIGTIPVFLSLTKDAIRNERIRIAIWSSLIAGLIVGVFAISGQAILDYFDISIEAVRVSGGLLLLYIAFQMIMSGKVGYENVTDKKSIIVSPLAIPILAGPGSMSFAMIAYLSLQGGEKFYLLAAILIVSFIGAITLSFSSFINDLLGKEFMRGLEKIMAIVISFIALEMIMSGIKAYFFK